MISTKKYKQKNPSQKTKQNKTKPLRDINFLEADSSPAPSVPKTEIKYRATTTFGNKPKFNAGCAQAAVDPPAPPAFLRRVPRASQTRCLP